MDIELKPWQGNEKLYFYPQTTQIAGQTGLMGRLWANFSQSGDSLYKRLDDMRSYLKDDDFTDDMQNVIEFFQKEENDSPFASKDNMAEFLKKKGVAELPSDDGWYGFRTDTENYSFMFRLNAESSDYNIHCFCYKKNWLNQHIQNSENGIRFITSDYKNKFRIADGDRIGVTYPDKSQKEFTVRYVDEYHFELQNDGKNSELYHICEFAEMLEKQCAAVDPVDEPLGLINARFYCPLILSVFETDEYGNTLDECVDYDGRACLNYEEEIKALCKKEHSYFGCDPQSMATYQDNVKIRSVEFDVEEIDKTLYGCIKCKFSEPLSVSEEKEFREWLAGQCSDGFGEGLGQREFEIEGGIASVGFWSCEDDYFMKNENDFAEYINAKNPMKMGEM